MKKGLKFTKSQLEELYSDKKLSLIEIGKIFGCRETNILYWLKKFDIKRRPSNPNYVHISKEELYDLYWNKGLKTQEIANKFGIKRGRSILKKMKKYRITSKTVSQALTKKLKRRFNGNLDEKAYLLGLRAGDFHAKRIKECIRVQTTTTHLAQIELLKKSFEKYGEICSYYSKNKARADEWFIYVDLDKSFDFLLEKPNSIPNWISDNYDYFFQFLSAYVDCEGNWHLTKSHDIRPRFTLRLRTGDKLILKDIRAKLESLGHNPIFYLDTRKGSDGPSAKFRNDIFGIILNRKREVIKIINNILQFSKHSEKIRKMKFILENRDNKWKEIKEGWIGLRNEIKKELLKNQI